MKTLWIAAWALAAGTLIPPASAQLRPGGLQKNKAPKISGPARESQEKKAFEKLRAMPPERRGEALAKLPPKRREELEKKLGEYDKMTPAQRKAVHESLARFDGLPPARKQQIRRVYNRFNNLPEDRKPVVREEFQRMQSLTADARRARMNSDEFRNKYNAQERALVAELSEALPRE